MGGGFRVYDLRVDEQSAALAAGWVGFLGALLGALIGAAVALYVANKTREADRRTRCVDRVLEAITQLDAAYAAYVTDATNNAKSPHLELRLQGAVRGYDQAVQMLHVQALRNAAVRYRELVTEYFLMFGEPRDELDAEREVPTLQQLNAEHAYLADKLRRFEGKM